MMILYYFILENLDNYSVILQYDGNEQTNTADMSVTWLQQKRGVELYVSYTDR